MRGYSSADVADFLRVEFTFAPQAEAEWVARGGAYMSRRLGCNDFVRAVRRRLQKRDPLTGIPEAELFGAVEGVPGAPRPGEAGYRDPWNPVVIPVVRRYFYQCLEEGVAPVYTPLTKEQEEARAEVRATSRAYLKARADTTKRAVAEQWEAYCKLYEVPKDLAKRAEEQEAASQLRKAAAGQSGMAYMLRLAARKKEKMAEARARILEAKRNEALALAAEVAAKTEKLAEAERARAEAMGFGGALLGSKTGRLIIQAQAAARQSEKE